MLIDEIKSMLEKHGYEITPDGTTRIETMIESLRDDNQLLA
jgi:tetrahydromethanopterin S-methyltransferase subunit F